jgi:hypothetical protein
VSKPVGVGCGCHLATAATKHADLAGAALPVSPSVVYAIFAGIFQQALIRHLGGSEAAADGPQATTERIRASPVTDV